MLKALQRYFPSQFLDIGTFCIFAFILLCFLIQSSIQSSECFKSQQDPVQKSSLC